MPLDRDRAVADLAAVVVAGGEPRFGNLDIAEVASRGVDERGDLGAFERDRAALGIVLVVAGSVGRVLHDLFEVAGESFEPSARPNPLVLEFTSDRVTLLCVHPLLR